MAAAVTPASMIKREKKKTSARVRRMLTSTKKNEIASASSAKLRMVVIVGRLKRRPLANAKKAISRKSSTAGPRGVPTSSRSRRVAMRMIQTK